jgi:SAM-dependent methyltransferase
LGHKVTLVDPVPKHIQKATRKAGNFRCILGDARSLPFNNADFDLVILHGPLYHLQFQDDRLLALKEARRIIRPGGTALGFAITHPASALAALHNGMIHDPQIFSMCSSELLTGEHQAPEGMNGILQCAYYHRPDELLTEFIQSGFHINGLHAVEGMAWIDHNFFESWYDPQKKKNLMELINITDQDQSLLCLSPHMMVSASPFL